MVPETTGTTQNGPEEEQTPVVPPGPILPAGATTGPSVPAPLSPTSAENTEETFRILFEHNPHPMWVYDLQTLAFLAVNEAAIVQYGYSRDEFLRMRIADIRPSEDIPRLLSDVRSARPDLQHSGEWRHRRKDGQIRDVEITSHTLSFMGCEAALVVAQDITERKRLENERAYILSSVLCLLWWAEVEDGGGQEQYLHWNMRFPDMEAAQRFVPLPLKEGETYKEGWYLYRLPEDRDRCDRIGTAAVRAGHSYEQEFRMRCADGQVRWLHEHIYIETLVPGKRWKAVGVCTDITDRKRLEDQLLQAQKLESVGRLAGGVAHDFNNLLAVIAGYAELAEEELPANLPIRHHLRAIQEATGRAANLTSQLLAFARKQMIEPRPTNLNDVARKIDAMLHRLIGENIELVTHLSPDLGLVSVDVGQFEQILVNLAVNARDAMPDGGKLTIETCNAILDSEYASQHAIVAPGDYVMLSVSDTGSGIDAAIREHIFDPFFTTKEQGKGTGLGLATVYGIVQQSGGTIWLYSEPGHGTTFKIYLPRIPEKATVGVERSETLQEPVGKETILVVEDEPTLRLLTATVLQRLGYTVLEAGNGEQGLQVAESYAGVIDLLVTDVVMPKLGGRLLGTRLQQARSGLKVLYTSGYTDDAIVHHGVLEADVAFLQKPFTPSTLARKVRDVLDAK